MVLQASGTLSAAPPEAAEHLCPHRVGSGLVVRFLLIISIISGAEIAHDIYDGFQQKSQLESELSVRALSEARTASLTLERTFESARQLMGALAKFPSIRDRDVSACHARLESVGLGLPMYDYISANDRDGTIECAANQPPPGIHAEQWIMNKTISSGEFVVGFYARNKLIPDREVIRLGYPITGIDGKTTGVLSTGLSLEWLNQTISRWQLPEGAVLDIADANGTLIARRPDAQGVGHQAPPALLAALTDGSAGVVMENGLDGTRRVFGHTFMKVGPIGGVFVAVGLDRDAAMVGINRAIERNFAISLLILLAASTLTWISMRRIIGRPIQSLLAAAARWQHGDWNARASVHTGIPEFDGLGASFDAMADAVSLRTAELTRAAESLRRSEQHLAHAQRVARVGSFEFDPATGHIEWSDENYRIFGVDKDKGPLSFDRVIEMVLPEDREILRRTVQRIEGSLPLLPEEFRITRPDGTIRTLQSDIEAIRDSSGKVVKLIGVDRDVTELREAERERDELERQLLHAQKLEAIGTLAGGIAHDLNNTLLPVIALTTLSMKQVPTESRVHECLGVIHEAGIRGRDLVRQILTFARKGEPQKGRVDLVASLSAALRLLRSTLPTSIAIRDCLQRVPDIWGDEAQIHQIVMNLVTNAAQAIGDNMGTITVELAPTAAADGSQAVRLSVIDTGCGMDAATQNRIFDPFFTTKGPGEGTGLGLSVVYGIVTAHHGTISVESTPGQGTRFDIVFPEATEALPDRQISIRELQCTSSAC